MKREERPGVDMAVGVGLAAEEEGIVVGLEPVLRLPELPLAELPSFPYNLDCQLLRRRKATLSFRLSSIILLRSLLYQLLWEPTSPECRT